MGLPCLFVVPSILTEKHQVCNNIKQHTYKVIYRGTQQFYFKLPSRGGPRDGTASPASVDYVEMTAHHHSCIDPLV